MELDILNAWEQALGQQPCKRELTLLSLVSPEISGEEALNLRIGQKNAFLLTLREMLFGTEMAGTETCPTCGDKLEFVIHTSDLRLPVPEDSEGALSFLTSDYDISFRVPVCNDLIALGPDADQIPDRDTVFEHCILTALKRGKAISPEALPPDIKAEIANRMREHDLQAETRISLTCPACDHEWGAAFDIGLFLWEELNAWANRTLYEIHQLASAYGWAEQEILQISPLRRQYYLEQVSQ